MNQVPPQEILELLELLQKLEAFIDCPQSDLAVWAEFLTENEYYNAELTKRHCYSDTLDFIATDSQGNNWKISKGENSPWRAFEFTGSDRDPLSIRTNPHWN